MTSLYPLVFREHFLEKPWGGRKLKRLLDKDLPDGVKIGESWELSDVEGRVSVIENGELSGTNIDELLEDHREKLLGKNLASRFPRSFPLLVKYIDASEFLSVQVHPKKDWLEARKIDEPPKHEVWYVLYADPGSYLYHGVREGVTKDDLRNAKGEEILALLNKIEVAPGDVIPIAPGTVHALGAGIVVAEVQVSADTTLRLYDYGRKEANGSAARELHVEDAIDQVSTESQLQKSRGLPLPDFQYERLLLYKSSMFSLELLKFDGIIFEKEQPGTFAVLSVIEGAGDIIWTADKVEHKQPFKIGDTILVPAIIEEFNLNADTECKILRVHVP
ncbi:MAG: class I mannose-6-phosphate isomerase [Planctomycetes bacterium]|nr:class I mannose-6-phosphate isomerase [Planctomycetota bacterium]